MDSLLLKFTRRVLWALLFVLTALLFSACSSDGGGGGNGGLTDAATPEITVQPQGATYSQNASSIPLSVTASVPDGGSLSYQWFSNSSDINEGGTLITGETAAEYTPPTTSVGTVYYYVVVSNTNPDATGSPTAKITSSVAVIAVNALIDAETPTISAQPQSATYNQNDAVPLSVTAEATDGGSLTYQWFSNTSSDTVSGRAILSATASTYTVPTDEVGTFYYYVVVINTNNNVNGRKTAVVTSAAAVVTVVFSGSYTAKFYESGVPVTEISRPAQSTGDITIPSPTPITGYTFEGWHIDNAGSSWAADSSYYLNVNTNFYARWTPEDPTTPKAQAVFYDDGIELEGISIEEYPANHMTLPVIIRKGHTLKGWKPEGSADTVAIYAISVDTNFNSDFELTAPFTEIRTAADMEIIRTGLSGSYKLMEDIDLEGVNWTPIGYDNKAPFTGVFEGNGKTIKRFRVSAGGNYSGLFGYISGGARVANLTIEVTGTGVRGLRQVGGIAGYAVGVSEESPAKIVNTHVKISAGQTSSITNGQNTGGILGSSGAYVTIIGCSNELPVSGKGDDKPAYTGGIIGYIESSGVKIYNSWNTGAITSVNRGAVSGQVGAFGGGIVGGGTVFIINSYNTGSVTATSTGNTSITRSCAGGISGRGGGTISNSYNTGEVNATSPGGGASANDIVGC